MFLTEGILSVVVVKNAHLDKYSLFNGRHAAIKVSSLSIHTWAPRPRNNNWTQNSVMPSVPYNWRVREGELCAFCDNQSLIYVRVPPMMCFNFVIFISNHAITASDIDMGPSTKTLSYIYYRSHHCKCDMVFLRFYTYKMEKKYRYKKIDSLWIEMCPCVHVILC